jgi:hypothetical protein
VFQYGNMQQHESNVILASKRSDMRYLKAESHESVEKKISVRFRIACDHIETHSNCGVLSIPASKQDITKHFKPRSLRSGAQKRDGRVCFNMVYQLLVSSYKGTGEGTPRLGISDTDYRRNDGCIRHC